MSNSTYKIIVRGRLTPALAGALDGFEIAECDRGLTSLIGCVPDQRTLHQAFRVLRDLNIELVSLNPVTENLSDLQVTA